MKKLIGLLVIIAALFSCEPVEKRVDIGGAVTQADIDKYVSVTVKVMEGKQSNYIICKSEGLKALTSFKHGLGTYIGVNGEVQGYLIPGNYTVVCTVLNRDGSKVEKNFPVTVDACFNVAPEWELFCGAGTKAWTWSLDESTQPYGMGDALADGPDWWCPEIAGDVEGPGATMSFSTEGTAFTKKRTNGAEVAGLFSFDMGKRFPNYSRSLGQLTTTIPVLVGQTTGGDTGIGAGGKDVLVYEIIKLTEDKLFLIQVEPGMSPDTEGWGQACWWMFKAVKQQPDF